MDLFHPKCSASMRTRLLEAEELPPECLTSATEAPGRGFDVRPNDMVA